MVVTTRMNPELLYDQAQHFLNTGKHGEAYKLLQKLDRTIPNHPGILYLLGICQSLGGKKQNAISTYLRAIKIQPTLIEAYNNVGLDLCSLGRHNEALNYFDQALKIKPGFKEAALNRANTLISVHRLNDAITELETLLNAYPNCPSVLTNIGDAFSAATKDEGALSFYEAALAAKPDDTKILGRKISSLAALKRWEECIACFDLLPAEATEKVQLKSTKIQAQLKINDWSDIDTPREILEAILHPLTYLHCNDSQLSQLKNARNYAEKFIQQNNLVATNHQKIRVGYVSADFRDHPVGYLTAGLFETHDKSEFEIFCLSLAAPENCTSVISKRIQENCDQFLYIDQISDSEAVNLIRSLHLDVAFDLGGYTSAARTNLFASRIAPIQISYLGFPGSMGASFMDYLIGDPLVTPKHLYEFYSEKIISLPKSFQANDGSRRINPTSRFEQGLPDDALILACFNQSSKITPAIFHAWMEAMRQAPKTILWLAKECDTQADNLKTEAEKLGVDRARLFFADRCDYANHLGRYALVDLALDTSPFNGGTTTSDALWGSAPVLTLCGETYANRMAASLVHSLGLNSLITHTLEEYRSRLINLVTRPHDLVEVKHQLGERRIGSALFNTKTFTQHFEIGLHLAVTRSRSGQPPDHIEVYPIP